MSSESTQDAPRLEDERFIGYTPTARVVRTLEAVPTPFRPAHRPPMALLSVGYDGREDGETIPIRGRDYTIGRSGGDLLIGHDTMMSARHAKITLERLDGRYLYYLNDLDSKNGTFVRIAGGLLKNANQLLVGGRHYRFDDNVQGTSDIRPPDPSGGGTRGWQTVSASDLMASLVEVKSDGTTGQRFFLQGRELWFGADAGSCQIVVGGDPFLDPRAFRLFRDPRDRWHLDNAQSVNGTWLRVQRVAVRNVVQFQLGEQRFLLRVL
jgi:hypothetical protein